MATRQQKNPLLQSATIGDVLYGMQQVAKAVEARLDRAGIPRDMKPAEVSPTEGE